MQLNLQILDIDHAAVLDKTSVGCYLHLGGRLIDVIVFSQVNSPIEVPLDDASELLRIQVKHLANDENVVGKILPYRV